MHAFINCFAAEWMKKRRSFAAWLVFIGGFFIPFITVIIFMIYPKQLLAVHATVHFWQTIFQKSWQLMAIMLLPMGIVLAVSLITQIEFKNNGWKQLHTTPLTFTCIFFCKLAILLVMLLQLFIFFNIGIFLSAIIPAFFNSDIPFPEYAVDAGYFFRENATYFIMCLPMVALLYMISLQFKNFLIPVGAGLALVVAGMIAISWKYAYVIPSSYLALRFLQTKSNVLPVHNLVLWSLAYFIIFTLLSYCLYIFKKEKG